MFLRGKNLGLSLTKFKKEKNIKIKPLAFIISRGFVFGYHLSGLAKRQMPSGRGSKSIMSAHGYSIRMEKSKNSSFLSASGGVT